MVTICLRMVEATRSSTLKTPLALSDVERQMCTLRISDYGLRSGEVSRVFSALPHCLPCSGATLTHDLTEPQSGMSVIHGGSGTWGRPA